MLDIRAILSSPLVYSLLQNLVRSRKHTTEFVENYIQPNDGDVILDVGCGPAAVLDFLPKVKYYGFDLSPQYIENAKKKYGDRGTFSCNELSEVSVPENVEFNIVLANNVLHHLNDAEVIHLLNLAKSCLKTGGRLITSDGCHAPDEGFVSKTILSLDRGKYVREKEEYLNLAHKVFDKVEHNMRKDLNRMSINSIIISYTK